MKKTILLTFLLFGFLSGYSQTITMKTSSVSICEKMPTGKWSNWTDFKKAEVLITIDAKKTE